MKVKYAIIDDNNEALEALEYYLNTITVSGLELELVDKQNDLSHSTEKDHELLTNIDVLFLDIMLKEKNSLDILPKFKEEQPITIITTAHDTHMLKAIRLSAFDYLLKPVDEDDIVAVLERLKERLEREYNRMREWLSLSAVINPDQLSEEQTKQITTLQDPIFEAVSSAFPNLTIQDKRLLTLIKFGFNNKEIAQHLSIEPESVKRSKVRLKKRMKLPREKTIEAALTTIL